MIHARCERLHGRVLISVLFPVWCHKGHYVLPQPLRRREFLKTLPKLLLRVFFVGIVWSVKYFWVSSKEVGFFEGGLGKSGVFSLGVASAVWSFDLPKLWRTSFTGVAWIEDVPVYHCNHMKKHSNRNHSVRVQLTLSSSSSPSLCTRHIMWFSFHNLFPQILSGCWEAFDWLQGAGGPACLFCFSW